MIDIKRIDGEWLSEEECYRKYKDLVYMSLSTLIPAAKNAGVDPADLISEGNIGFIKSYRKYDEYKGFKFSTYATKNIKFEALKFLQNYSKVVKYPRRTLELATKIQRNYEGMTEKEISELLHVPLKTVEDAFASMNITASLQKVVQHSDNEKTTLIDQIGIYADFTQIYVKDFLESLQPKERDVLVMWLEGKYTQTDIAKHFGFSQMQASRIIRGIGKRYLEQEA